MKYPYQLVAFLDSEPKAGESIYLGKNGWYSQIALKRRFGLRNIEEQDFIAQLGQFIASSAAFSIELGEMYKPEQMPVRAIPVLNDTAHKFHASFIERFSERIKSKYPEREGENYFPHVTVEWNGELVLSVEDYEYTTQQVNDVWLVKDPVDGQDSLALQKFPAKH